MRMSICLEYVWSKQRNGEANLCSLCFLLFNPCEPATECSSLYPQRPGYGCNEVARFQLRRGDVADADAPTMHIVRDEVMASHIGPAAFRRFARIREVDSGQTTRCGEFLLVESICGSLAGRHQVGLQLRCGSFNVCDILIQEQRVNHS